MRTKRALIISLVFLGAVALGSVFLNKERLVSGVFNQAIRLWGLKLNEINVLSISAEELVLGPITSKNGGIRAERVFLTYSPGNLLRTRLDSIRLVGGRVDIAVDEKGFAEPFSSLLPASSPTENTPNVLPVLPVDTIAADVVIFLKHHSLMERLDVSATLQGETLGYRIENVKRGLELQGKVTVGKGTTGQQVLLNTASFAAQSLQLSDFYAVPAFDTPLSARGDFTFEIGVKDLRAGRIADSLTIQIENLAVNAPRFVFDGIVLNKPTLTGQGQGTLQVFSGTLALKTKVEGGNADFTVGGTNLTTTADISFRNQEIVADLKSVSFPFVAEFKNRPITIKGRTPVPSLLVKWNLASRTGSVAGSFDGGFIQSNNPEAKIVLGYEQFAGDWNEGNFTVSGTFRNARLETSRNAPFQLPLSFSGNFELDGKNNLKFNGQASEADAVRLKFLGAHHSDIQSGNVDFEIGPLIFSQGGTQPNQYAPHLGGLISSVKGRLEGNGRIGWGQASSSELSVILDAMEFDTSVAKVAGLSTRLNFDSLFPIRTPKGQKIAVELIDVGVPLKGITAMFQLASDLTILVETASWPFAGGKFYTENAFFDLDRQSHTIALSAEQLNLAELCKILKITGLTGDGRLSGIFPLRVEGDAMLVEKAVLKAVDKGVIKYQAAKGQSNLSTLGKETGLLAKALENLHYDRLEVQLNGDLAREVEVRIAMAGHNPDLYNGYPLELNFSITGALGDMIRRGMIGASLPDSLKRKLEKTH